MNTTNERDNIFPVTKEEILENYPQVFDNEFQSRRFFGDSVIDLWTNRRHNLFFDNGYTKGHSTAAILVNRQGEKDYVVFWKYGGDYHNKYKPQYGYSFKQRETFQFILN